MGPSPELANQLLALGVISHPMDQGGFGLLYILGQRLTLATAQRALVWFDRGPLGVVETTLSRR
jgi:hypothetical protein